MTYKTKSKTINKTAVRTYISIIILNVNGLNAPTKRNRLAEWIKNKIRAWKIDLKIKTVKRGKEGHYIMIKGLIWEEDITIVNKYAPNVAAPQYTGNCLKEKSTGTP